jgi:hypothetical protein
LLSNFPESKQESVPDHPAEAKVSRISNEFNRESTFRDGYFSPDFAPFSFFNVDILRREYFLPLGLRF